MQTSCLWTAACFGFLPLNFVAASQNFVLQFVPTRLTLFVTSLRFVAFLTLVFASFHDERYQLLSSTQYLEHSFLLSVYQLILFSLLARTPAACGI
jgi:hypothetical protein